MDGPSMERLFKTVFGFGIILAILVAIGIFLLILKITLLFIPELHLMGMTIM